MTTHPELYDLVRTQWLYPSTPPITGPVKWVPDKIIYFNLHWTGATNTVGTTNEKALLNSIQKDYVTTRNYSFGYSSAVGLSGTTYEGRGTDFKAASNGDATHLDDVLPGNPRLPDNLEVFSCLLMIAQPDHITPAMINGVRRLYSNVCTMLGRSLRINGHNDLDPTACPGPDAQKKIDDNVFYPTTESSEMQVYRVPKRVLDTREGIGPASGITTYDLKLNSPDSTAAEVTITAIPLAPLAGFCGLNKLDSFINWTAAEVNIPKPDSLTVPVTDGKVTLYFSSTCHVIISVRSEG